MELLRCEHLTKIYGAGENQVTALSDVSFSVEKGEFVSVIGPSGSGKSTLLHILGGVDKPTSGKVFIDGTDMHALKPSDRLGVSVLQPHAGTQRRGKHRPAAFARRT